jgi:hypothetical protein
LRFLREIDVDTTLGERDLVSGFNRGERLGILLCRHSDRSERGVGVLEYRVECRDPSGAANESIGDSPMTYDLLIVEPHVFIRRDGYTVAECDGESTGQEIMKALNFWEAHGKIFGSREVEDDRS